MRRNSELRRAAHARHFGAAGGAGAARGVVPAKAGAKAKPGAREAKPIKVRSGEKVAVVLSGGNPGIAKADGDAPVQAYIAGMPGWKRDPGREPFQAPPNAGRRSRPAGH